MGKYAPIVVFTYCRLTNIKQTIDSLLSNDEAKESDIFIYSDAAKDEKTKNQVNAVRQYIRTVTGFRSVTIIEREHNYGLVKNIILGVTDIVNEYGKILVLEDDMTVSKYFLRYINEGLERYKDDNRVASIHGYVYNLPQPNNLPETFFIKGADCWGWATWKRAWNVFNPDAKFLFDEIVKNKMVKKFEFDYSYPYMTMLKNQINGKSKSWAICWYASTFLKGMLTLYPSQSMVKLNGLDGVGSEHGGTNSKYCVQLRHTPISVFPEGVDIIESEDGRKGFKNFFLSDLSIRGIIAFILRNFNIRP